MTQDVQFSPEANPFAAAEQVCATLGTLTDALFDHRTTRHPAASLTALREAHHPAAEALFGLPLAPNGPVHTALDRLGTVITAGTARPGSGARLADRATTDLHERYGGGAVRGAIADRGTTSAALFQLPVTGEFADAKLRPPFTPALAALAAGQQTRQPVELPTGAGAEVRLVVPPGFHALTSPGGPAGATARTVPARRPGTAAADPAALAAAEELTGHLGEVADELFGGAGPEPRRDFAVITATLADLFQDSGTAYAGVCALESDGRATDAALVVSLARHPLPITGLATELATVRRHAEVWTVLLPAGPAAVLVEARTVPVPAPLAADGQRRWVVTSVVEAFVPLPDGGTVLCVQLSTARPEDWELYTGAFAELLKSIQFGWDGEAVRPAAGPAPAAVPAPATDPVIDPVIDPVPAAPVGAPPVDFNPFAPVAEPEPAPRPTPAPSPEPAAEAVAAVAEEAVAEAVEVVEEEPKPRKGTPVLIPPPDFDPFAPPTMPLTPAAEPAAAAGAGAAPDPFGTTVAAEQPRDPFGTTVASDGPAVPPPPSTPPRIPAPAEAVAEAAEDEEPKPRKGTPVMIPPPDFDPFAPPTMPLTPPDEPTAEAEADRTPEHRPFG
ncbi:hypothetical protein [Streptomyces rubellomurinus]|uniref:Uncharacterized protein n=1 Tax=Streptomyces rubellomurinus (strain ATCC 31215) TaxID=359131 RepID=A0A0F2T9Z4_STRR3|nr:hypothetical protein [Streptomyces rubellomurinus]KJS60013.1 hypothetical protein VM95_23655 [Streptomyces rubellomurinus]